MRFHQRPRSVRAAAAVAGFAIALSACGTGTPASGSPASGTPASGTPAALTKVTILQDWVLDATFAPHLFGIENGIFEKHGIDLELVSGQGSEFSMQQLNENQVQFATADLLAYLADRAVNDSPTTAVMTQLDSPTAGILTTQPVDALEDLAGKQVAIAPFSVFRLVLPVVLQQNGLERDAVDIELIETGSFALLFEGEIDAMEAYKAGSLATGMLEAEDIGTEVHYLDMADFGLVGYDKILVVRNDVIEDNPDLVRRLTAALRESVDQALAASDEEIADLVVAKAPELQRDEVILQWQQMKELVDDIGAFDNDVVATNLTYLTEGLEIDHDLQPEDVFTNDFIPAQ
jgi:NitT/TauT family transport system substrate-binding protein